MIDTISRVILWVLAVGVVAAVILMGAVWLLMQLG